MPDEKLIQSANISLSCTNAALIGNHELTFLKGRQRFNAIWTLKRWILRCINFGIGESSPNLFLAMVNLHLKVCETWWILKEGAIYCFIIFFIWKWIVT